MYLHNPNKILGSATTNFRVSDLRGSRQYISLGKTGFKMVDREARRCERPQKEDFSGCIAR